MAARKIDGWWYADFYVRGERYRERSPQNTVTAAREYEQFLRGEIAKMGSLKHLESQTQPETKAIPSFAEFAERWLREFMPANYRWSEQRPRGYTIRAELIPAFGRHCLDKVTSQHIETYKLGLQRRGLTKKTINNYLSILRKCFSTAVEWKLIDEVPTFRLLRTKDPPPFTYLRPGETPRLLQAMPVGLWQNMALVAVRTGLRYSELVALRWEDIDFDTKLICVQRAEVYGRVGPTKNERIRYVPMCNEVLRTLNELSSGNDRVFSLNGKSVTYSVAWRVITSASRRAGIRYVTWHDLRHTFASDLTRCKVSLHAIKELLGHESIEMTLRYAHLGEETLHEAVANLDLNHEAWAAVGQNADSASNHAATRFTSSARKLALSSRKRRVAAAF